MLLELLKDAEVKAKVQHCYLLFPTIERMAVSSNGFWFTKVVQPLWFALRYMYVMFSKLPVVLQVFLLSVYFFIMGIPRTFLGTGLKYSRLSITDKVLYLADEEMRIVRDADVATIRVNLNLLKFYYGASDGWAPIKYCEELKAKVPGLDATVDIYNISHAFVLRSSVQMGRIVAGWITEFKRN